MGVFFIISVNCNFSFRKKYWLKLTRNAWLCWCSVIVGLLMESSLLSSVCVDILLRPSDTAFLRKKLAFISQFLVCLQVWTVEKYFRKWKMFYWCDLWFCVHEDTHKHCLRPEQDEFWPFSSCLVASRPDVPLYQRACYHSGWWRLSHASGFVL